MKTKKVLWGFLIAIFIISCSTDDLEVMEENVEVDSEINIDKSLTNKNDFECNCDDSNQNIQVEIEKPIKPTSTLNSDENDEPEDRHHTANGKK